MDYWYQNNPEDFFDQIGPNITSDVYHKYKEDIKLMEKINLNSFRTSIQWTRLMKDVEKGEVDNDAVAFYRDYFSSFKKANIKLVVNLFHFDMPIKFENIGGFANFDVVDAFVNYAETCFKLFGDLVDYWTTFNEPVVPIEGCYLYKWYYPKIVDFKLGIQAAFGTILANAKVVNLFHKMFSTDNNKRIGIILNVTPTYPASNEIQDIKAAKIRDQLFNRVFLDTAVKGRFNDDLIKLLKDDQLLPKYQINDLKEINNAKVDFLGINYYQPVRVQAPIKIWNDIEPIMPEKWFEKYESPERRINPSRGWEIYPSAIFEIGEIIKNEYNNIPWFISENGIGIANEELWKNESGQIQDDYRIEFISEHLYWLNKTIQNGSNCFGYHMWTFVDCWSWANAYKNRYGFVSLNLETQKRTLKKSAYWFKKIISNDGEIEILDNVFKN
ncbi:MAG: 6-phospho-beta-glucosidase [Williamsoniiplasma luminosum]|uniref:6-phospho-beta-glucosidase n=2 Tax=Williamsoniiplasma luminosum TaxID=214888 RepID=A0A2S0NL95_9MOLU|nr:MAG: 6-phospho-beta-glucosidase [Williamsoniiplasma luminosum]